MQLADGIADWPEDERGEFLSHFGEAIEEWYYQEIDGKPYVIAIAEGTNLEEGFSRYPTLDDPFFVWFREQVLELSGIDLRAVPKGGSSELVFKISA